MNVRISYAIDLDEVPSKIVDILNKLNHDEVARLVRSASGLIETSPESAEMVDKLLEQARTKLADFDRTVNDCQMILKGYAAAKKDPKDKREGSDDAD